MAKVYPTPRVNSGAGIAALASTVLTVILCHGCGPDKPTQTPATAGPVGAEPGEAERVVADVEHISRAMYSNDVDTIVAFTHPRVIQQMGGPARTKTLLQNSLSRIQSLGVAVESCTCPEKPGFAQNGSYRFAIVPIKIVLALNGKRRESLNCQVGIRDPGATNWTYIDSSEVRNYFPEFPSNVVIPKPQRK